MCIDIEEICFGIANGQISSILTEMAARNTSVFYFQDNILSKYQWTFTKFDMCIYTVEVCFEFAHLQISSILTELSVRNMIMAGHYRFTFYLVINMNLAQNVCRDDFYVRFETGSLMTYISWSSYFVLFFCLDQFLSNS